MCVCVCVCVCVGVCCCSRPPPPHLAFLIFQIRKRKLLEDLAVGRPWDGRDTWHGFDTHDPPESLGCSFQTTEFLWAMC
jgi:hypothetical protein